MSVTNEDVDALFELKDSEPSKQEVSKSPLAEPMFLDEDEDGNLSF
jgi:hypothetical protein